MSVPLPIHPPEAPAVVTPDAIVTWREWERQIERAAERLRERAPRGGIVACLAADPVETAALVLGALRSEVLLAPLSLRLPPPAREAAADRLGAVWLDGSARADCSRLPEEARGRPGVVVFTSGSTGEPKAALLPAEALLASARGVNEALAFGVGDRWLLDLPLSHVGGLGVVVRAALAGAVLAVPAPRTPTTEALRTLGATHASLVSTQLYRFLRDTGPDERFAALRALLLGGSAIAPVLLDEATARGLPVATSYGLTEMASTVTATSPGARRGALATAGVPLPGRVVRVMEGEIRVGGAPLFAGYLHDGHLDRPLGADGLFATGDLGRVDEAGRLHVTGRRDNRFVSGGENVQPEEVEVALAALPGVVRAVVVPVPDAEFGQRGVAFVETEGGALDGARLAAALAERLPRYMVPARFLPWPGGAEGLKPSRAALRARAAAG